MQVRMNEKTSKKKANKMKDKYTFRNTVKGKFNSLVYDICKEEVKKLGKGYNPIFIFGKTGSGKTHFLKTIENEIKVKNPRKKVRYISCSDFAQEFVDSIKNNKLNRFRNKYRSVDALLIDNIDILWDKPQTQEEIFSMFNDLHFKHKLIVFTSNTSINGLHKDIDERLKSRFLWGAVIELKSPNYNDRIEIIKNYIKGLGEKNTFDEKTIKYIARNKKSDIRELEGVINKIMLYLRMRKIKCNINIIKNII